MTVASDQPLTLNYRLEGIGDDLGAWGHEYVRHLSGEIGKVYSKRIQEEKNVDDL